MECQPEEKQEEWGGARYEVKLAIAAILLAAFALFFCCKVNGLFDASGKYELESISVPDKQQDSQLLIDGDLSSCWPRADYKHERGEQIVFKFRRSRPIVALTLFYKDESRCRDVVVSCSDDGESWTTCDVVESGGDSQEGYYSVRYDFISSISVQYLRLEYASSDLSWIIQEVSFE